MTTIELLAPARDADIAIAAIDHGADAVYIGPAHHGARAAAGNGIDDIARVCDHAHRFNARVYATVNTLVYGHELTDVERLIKQLHHARVDALIVQDLGILRLNLPPIALHASTQCDIRTPAKARFLESLGFSQLVLARELTLEEIAAIHQAVKVPLECFVHGALCVSYSGRCAASFALKGRSANRGECAQLCRLPYDLTDDEGRVLVHNRHLLSLRDLNQSDCLEPLLQAGASSLKIEGRLKDIGYVKNVVAHYSQALNALIHKHPDQYRRSSHGTCSYTFTPQLNKSFNRGFTHYFLLGRRPPGHGDMASTLTPKSLGEPIGQVVKASGRHLRVEANVSINNGDGLSYFTQQQEYQGFRVNRAEGHDIFTNRPVDIAAGTRLMRTSDQAFDQTLADASSRRHVSLRATLTYRAHRLCLTLDDDRGNHVVHSIAVDVLAQAKTPQQQRQTAELGKLGNTIYRLTSAQVPGHLFIPASVLAQLRRETIHLLDRSQRMRRHADSRRPERYDAPIPSSTLTPADNVANHLAEQLLRDHGATHIAPALETHPEAIAPATPLMHTRYCIRRQLGACLRTSGARRLPQSLYLRSGDATLLVTCNCDRCEMTLTRV